MNPDGDCSHAQLAAGWVLGTLTADEAQRFASHVVACATCQAEAAGLREAADAMADAVPPAAPPPGLRGRLMATVRDEVELFRAAGARDSAPVNAPPRRRRLRSALLVVAAVSLVATGALLGLLVADPEVKRAQPRTFAGIVTPAAGPPDARASILVRGDETKLLLSRVEGAPAGQIYQAWIERPPSPPTPTGALFSVGAGGDTTISLPPLNGARRMIVTTEPSRGSAVPTLPPVMIVDLVSPGPATG